MPRKTTIKILNKCESSSQTRNTNLSCLKLNWKKRNNFVLEDEMQHIWYQTEKVVHYCFIRIWIEKSILVQLHNWVWNLVKKTSVNLSYTMQLRQHVRDSLEWVCMNPLTCCRSMLFLFFQLSLRHDRFVFRVNWKKRNNNKTLEKVVSLETDDAKLSYEVAHRLILWYEQADREYFWYISCDVWLRDGWNRSHLSTSGRRYFVRCLAPTRCW